jgi:transcriptional regulator with XRE-family HTH domain
MAHSIARTEGTAKASIGNHGAESQRGFGFLAEVKTPHLASEDFISRASWDGAVRYAVQRAEMDQYEVADEMPISHGYMSRIMRGTAGFTGPKLVKFMTITRSIAPLQWLADQMGYELKRKKPLTKREELLAQLAELEDDEKAA